MDLLSVLGEVELSWQVDSDAEFILQQPSTSSQVVALASLDGRLWTAPLQEDSTLEIAAAGSGADLVRPVIVSQCVFTVSQETVRFIRSCGDQNPVTMPLGNVSPGERLRLFVANERVWIDVLDDERAVYLPEDGDPEELENWGSALFLDDDSEGEADDALGENLVRGDNGDESSLLGDGEIQQRGAGFNGGPNQAPEARPDEVNARVGRSRIIQVLNNDSDPNGDLLVISDVENVSPEQGIVVLSPDRRTVQYTPAGGFSGTATFAYEVSDGNGGTDRATVQVTVVDDQTNNAPEPLEDRAIARAGQEISIAVLLNDDDPEGDPLELISVEGDAGATTVDRRLGIVTITPGVDVRGEIEFLYTVRDDLCLLYTSPSPRD